jgi:hypothetical protein
LKTFFSILNIKIRNTEMWATKIFSSLTF